MCACFVIRMSTYMYKYFICICICMCLMYYSLDIPEEIQEMFQPPSQPIIQVPFFLQCSPYQLITLYRMCLCSYLHYRSCKAFWWSFPLHINAFFFLNSLVVMSSSSRGDNSSNISLLVIHTEWLNAALLSKVFLWNVFPT